ncbi:MAG: Tm-1-like ATP-binding domain-containing protein [Candidatus Bathyarchaeia archaeon]
MSKTVAVIATLDTKGWEAKYLKEKLEALGKRVIIIDTGMKTDPLGVKPTVTHDMVAEAAGYSFAEISTLTRGIACEKMAKGVEAVVKRLFEEGRIDGVLAIGGLDGSLLASAGMRTLPIGFPKLLVSAVAQGTTQFGDFVGIKDVIVMHSVTDILGLNTITRKVFDEAAAAVSGMVDAEVSTKLEGGKTIAATMLGNTTPAVMRAKALLEERGFEVIAFHPNGTGGRAMEELIQQGFFTAVLDMTPHEVAAEHVFKEDDVYGGAGPTRLEGAGAMGIPQLVVPGCVDFIIQGPIEKLPEKHRNRKRYYFTPTVTLVRASSEEMAAVGRVMAEKLNKARGPTAVAIPLRGFSMYNMEGKEMYDPEADAAFTAALKENLHPRIPVHMVDAHINNPTFAETCASILLDLIQSKA